MKKLTKAEENLCQEFINLFKEHEIRVKNLVPDIGKIIFEKKQRLRQYYYNKKRVNKELKEFIAEKFSDCESQALLCLEWHEKTEDWPDCLVESLINANPKWSLSLLIAISNIPTALIPIFIKEYKQKIPKITEVRDWKNRNAPSSLLLEKEVELDDIELTYQKFKYNGLTREKLNKYLSDATKLRFEKLANSGVKVRIKSIKPRTNELIEVLEKAGFKVGKFGRQPRQNCQYNKQNKGFSVKKIDEPISKKIMA